MSDFKRNIKKGQDQKMTMSLFFWYHNFLSDHILVLDIRSRYQKKILRCASVMVLRPEDKPQYSTILNNKIGNSYTS